MSSKNKAAKAAAKHLPLQHQAFRLVVESLLDDLIESGNGFALDDEWVRTCLKDLFEARDSPEAFLKRSGAR